MDRTKKEALVAELHEAFSVNNLLVLTHQTGLSVGEVSELRQQMREAGASFKVTKNRLAKIALKGTKFEGLADEFAGPTAVAVSQDPVSAAKVVVDFAEKNDRLKVVCGVLGEDSLDAAQIEALAKLPSLDALRGKIIGLIQAPAQNITSLMQAPSGQLARVFGAFGCSGS